MRALIPFLILLYGIRAQAKCISDVYTLGASANSFNFKIENQSGNSFDLGSNVGLGFKLGHLLYCPEKKLEIYSHYQARYFSLAEAKTKSVFSQLQENVFLNSLGSDVRYLLNSRQEILLDLGLRQDYAPVRTEPSKSRILDDLFINLKILLGYRHFVFSNRTEDFTLSGKLGVLQPLEGIEAELGHTRELNLEYFRRIGPTYSIRADLYLLQSSQEVAKAIIHQKELGLRLNYLFRY